MGLTSGASFELEPYDGEPVTTVEMFHAWHSRMSEAQMRRLLAVPIDLRSRAHLEHKLAVLTAPVRLVEEEP